MFGIFRNWWSARGKSDATAPSQLPSDTRIYAIGDIHGRADLLAEMHEAIRIDLQRHPCETAIEIYIGDYIDRGAQSYEVVEALSLSRPLCDRRICLMGNHERILLDYLADPQVLSSWMSLGGLETLQSYGVRVRLSPPRQEYKAIHSDLLFRFPPQHQRFFRELRLSFSFGDYFFVHAGVRPGVPLASQQAEDLLWIRDAFLTSTRNFGAVVVHGHTPGHEPVVMPNRICIDTGAYVTGKLTCLVLHGNEKRFLTVTRQGVVFTNPS